jgi:hypothetical protein
MSAIAATLNSRTSLDHPRFAFIRKKWPECVGAIAYTALLAFAIPFHEPWADEAQAWQLARSLSLPDLFRHYLRYEGSPGLWHLLLHLLVKLHVSYTGMHWISGAIALAGVTLLIFCAPFPRAIRLTLPFTFFLAFQYAVVARSYVLVPLLLFATAAAWRKSPLLVALLLGLLGNASLHALAISGGMALLYIYENWRRLDRRTLLLVLAICSAFYGFAIWTVIPRPPYLSFVVWPSKKLPISIRLVIWSLRSCAALLTGTAQPLVLGIPLWILFIRQFVSRRMTIYLLPIATFAIFCGYFTNFWHSGLVVPTAITVCWIAWSSIAPRNTWTLTTIAGLLCIALQLAWTVRAISFDHTHAYSGDLAAARFLAPHVAAGELVAVTYYRDQKLNAFHSIGLYPYFDKPIFINQQRPFWLWDNRQHTDAQFEDALSRHPQLVDALLYEVKDRSADAEDAARVSIEDLLRSNGYSRAHIFCGEKPEGFHQREKICHVIFMSSDTTR